MLKGLDVVRQRIARNWCVQQAVCFVDGRESEERQRGMVEGDAEGENQRCTAQRARDCPTILSKRRDWEPGGGGVVLVCHYTHWMFFACCCHSRIERSKTNEVRPGGQAYAVSDAYIARHAREGLEPDMWDDLWS